MQQNKVIKKRYGVCQNREGKCEYRNSVFCLLFQVELEKRNKCLYICNQVYGDRYYGRP